MAEQQRVKLGGQLPAQGLTTCPVTGDDGQSPRAEHRNFVLRGLRLILISVEGGGVVLVLYYMVEGLARVKTRD